MVLPKTISAPISVAKELRVPFLINSRLFKTDVLIIKNHPTLTHFFSLVCNNCYNHKSFQGISLQVKNTIKVMKRDFETKFTGWAFIIAALLLWVGWRLSSHQIGQYIVASDFVAIGEDVWYWIWMYRIHIFGWVTMGIALFSLSSITMRNPFRVILLPGIGLAIIGTFTLAIATAFYYNFGAWGVGMTEGKSPAEIQEFVDGILYTNQYVTCFIRFGRIFSGVGLALLGLGFMKWRIVPMWLGGFTALLGLVAMGIILFIPVNFEIYKPIFHVKVIWLITMGVMVLKQGINLSEAEASK
jgi:hypothetical protein